jgi:two-component system, NarL family, sensor histidine kinase DegS
MTNPATTEPSAPASASEIAVRMGDEVAVLDKELGEVELLITQARAEATRHETRRAAAAEKLTAALAAAETRGEQAPESAELNAQLVLMTKRAALMESQVDVLEGKQRALTRFREAIAGYAEALGAAPDGPAEPGPSSGKGRKGTTAGSAADPIGSLPPAVSRLLLGAQEDMRREIARAMHDGPAQSLTNIVLQAQIVERFMRSDPTRAATEVTQLVGMVQQTLEATKTFIFEVRPMVLDDLGLVPTLRRAARDRGRRSGVAIEFESMGQDRRLPMDMESGLFRILDEALGGYLEARAERITLRMDWSADQLDVSVAAMREAVTSKATVAPDGAASKNLPPALAAMMEERRVDAQTAAETARRESIVELPPTTWREIQGRASPLGLTVDLSANGSELSLLAELPPASAEG